MNDIDVDIPVSVSVDTDPIVEDLRETAQTLLDAADELEQTDTSDNDETSDTESDDLLKEKYWGNCEYVYDIEEIANSERLEDVVCNTSEEYGWVDFNKGKVSLFNVIEAGYIPTTILSRSPTDGAEMRVWFNELNDE